jgi:hypothetical protein
MNCLLRRQGHGDGDENRSRERAGEDVACALVRLADTARAWSERTDPTSGETLTDILVDGLAIRAAFCNGNIQTRGALATFRRKILGWLDHQPGSEIAKTAQANKCSLSK